MKKKKLANLIMVLIIAGIVVTGVAVAISMQTAENDILGSEYKITAIKGNALISNPDTENICTITIRCDTILDNRDNLEVEKVPYVPKDGTILPVIRVDFSEGETVFDVLKRVCEAANLQIEYSWTPMYESYYIEGINHLYEFDCGPESGWMYKVNGWFPNYGCSSYTLTGGEEIVWCYTCNGLGADVGCSWME